MEKKPSKYKIQKQEIPEFDLSPEVERLQKQLDRDPNSKVFLPLAEEYRRSKMPEEAIFILEEGIKRNPVYSAAKIALARAFLEVNEFMKAKKVIDEVLNITPQNPLALKLHGDISFHEGDFLEARKAYEVVKNLNPMDTEVDSKLSELQVSVSGHKIEVASISQHEEDMQIERSYIEQKSSAQAGTQFNENNNLIVEQHSENQQVGFSVPSPPIPQPYQSPVESAPADNILTPGISENKTFIPDYKFVQEPTPQFSNSDDFPSMEQNSKYISPDSNSNMPENQQTQFQSGQFQEQNYPVGSLGMPNYARSNVQSDLNAVEDVPLVSHEVVMPDRYEEQQAQFAYPENPGTSTSVPDLQQANNYEQSRQLNTSGDEIFKIPADAGGFYTGPPTDPYLDQTGIGYDEVQKEMVIQTSQEFQPDFQKPVGLELTQTENVDIASEIPESSFDDLAQDQNVPTQTRPQSLKGFGINLDAEGQYKPDAIIPPVQTSALAEEFRLDELEAEINIPIPSKLEIDASINQQDVIQEQGSFPVAGDERITIDSLGIDELNVETMTKKLGYQETTVITTRDILSGVSSQYSEKAGVAVPDNIFKAPQTNPISAAPEIQQKQSAEKYNMDLAELYTKQGHFDKALDIYKILLESQPDNQNIINRLIDTEKKKNSEHNKESNNISPTERIAKMEEWFRSLLKDKKDSGS